MARATRYRWINGPAGFGRIATREGESAQRGEIVRLTKPQLDYYQARGFTFEPLQGRERSPREEGDDHGTEGRRRRSRRDTD